MSYRSLIQKQVQAAFKQMGDIPLSVTYVGPPTFDDETSSVSPGTEQSVPAILSDYTERQIDGVVVQASDRQVLIAAADLSTDVSTDGSIIIENSTYQIVNAATDPAKAMWTVQVRR